MTDTITTELRGLLADINWTEIIDHMRTSAGAVVDGDWLDAWHEAASNACDAIDAIHANLEAENESLRRELDRVLGEQEDRDGWVHLPVDADGEVIHVGDVMDGYGKTIEVVELRYGRSGWVLISRDGNGYADTFAFTHHREPTVEDVLREFAEKVTDSQIPGVHPTYEEAIAEYASRLRLADDGREQ